MRARFALLLGCILVAPRLSAQETELAQADRLAEPVYHLRLSSAWPELRLSPECVNGGNEVLNGSLRRVSPGLYRGALQRETTIRFCGAHGSVGDACSVTLRGSGTVLAEGTVLSRDEQKAGDLVELRWFPDSTTLATVTGDCPQPFGEQLRTLYTTTSHSVELIFPTDGSRMERQPVRDYGWVVDIW
jgi:hypothetical protein